MLKAIIQTVTPFQQNASIIFCDETKKCAIVDPGGDIEIILETAKKNNLLPEKILLTHGHIDHAGGATEIAEILNVEIHGPHINDKFLLDELQKQGEMFGMLSKNCNPDKWLNEGDTIELGNEKLEVYFCPGHTPGHMGYMIESEGKNLFLGGDFANHYIWSWAYPDWELRFDRDREGAAQTRRRILGMLADEKMPFIGYHMPWPGLGYVETRGDGFRYVPASYQMML